MDKTQNEIKITLSKFKEKISSTNKIDKLILFGSRAKGTSKKNSDVDLLLISKDFKGKKYFRRAPKFYRMWDYDYDVDIICLTPEEISARKRQVGIIREAVKEGIEIY